MNHLLGPVFQNFVSLTSSLRLQLVKLMSTTYANTVIFRIAKDSHILSTTNNSVFVIFKFEILTNHYLTISLILSNWALVCKFTPHVHAYYVPIMS